MPAAETKNRAGADESQLVLYARDLKRAVTAEQRRARELEQAHRQSQAYAVDLKKALEAERLKGRELEQAYYQTVLRLTRACGFKDSETGAHIRRLSHYSEALALHLNLPEPEARMIRVAAPMHDIGKIGLPDALLCKQGPLTEDEWRVMRQHPVIGANLLEGSNSPLLEVARQIALTHHERWDGSGYPQGLQGEEIPLAGRIVMLADQYDALRSPRSYKAGFDHARAVDIILKGDARTRPEHFDPKLLEAFAQMHPTFDAIYERYSDANGDDGAVDAGSLVRLDAFAAGLGEEGRVNPSDRSADAVGAGQGRVTP